MDFDSKLSDFYKILNVDKECSFDDIKTAYKKLILKWHPDRNENKEVANEKFKEINEAYQILLKELTKHSLKENDSVSSGENMQNNREFENIEKIPNCQVFIEITLEEAYNGVTKDIVVNRTSICKQCNSKNISKCGLCDGIGYKMSNIKLGSIDQNIKIKCDNCNGGNDVCKKCDGKHFLAEQITLELDIPKGVYDGYCIYVTGEGNEIPSSISNSSSKQSVKSSGKETTKRSDVEIIIKEKTHKYFRRQNKHDLYITLKISLAESLCGINKRVKYFNDYYLLIEYNNIIKHGDKLMIRDRGMPNMENENIGKMYIYFDINYPVISDNVKKELKRLLI